MEVVLYPAVRNEIKRIWVYTKENWGDRQADRYVTGMYDALQALGKNRMSQRTMPDENLKGVYFFRYEHHYVFFKEVTSKCIGVILILHESMDVPNHLKNKLNKS